MARPKSQPRRSVRTCSTVDTSAVLPGSTQLRTGMPSRVTARATKTCGDQVPSLLWPNLRKVAFHLPEKFLMRKHDTEYMA
jgi:hypothetical protein